MESNGSEKESGNGKKKGGFRKIGAVNPALFREYGDQIESMMKRVNRSVGKIKQ